MTLSAPSPVCRVRARRRSNIRTVRRGRLLVECVVAIVLLSATSVVVLALARSATRTRQSAEHSVLAWAFATAVVDGANGLTCRSATPSGVFSSPLIAVEWTDATGSRYRQRDIRITPVRSALAGPAPAALTIQAARYCP